jgi:hypothetical protein
MIDGSYVHVTAERRHLVDAPNELRIRSIYEDVWIGYPMAAHALDLVGTFLQMPPKTQAPCLLIHGDPGMGKTTIYEKIVKKYGISSGNEKHVVSLTFEDNCVTSHKQFRSTLIEVLTSGIYKGGESLPELAAAIKAQNVAALAIDEFHDMLYCNKIDILKNLKLIKDLSGKNFGISIIVLGIDRCKNVFESDGQMYRRFERHHLTKWSEGKDLRSFLANYQSTLPLKYPSLLHQEPLVKYLVNSTKGVLDEIVKTVCNAGAWAVINGTEQIDLDTLKLGAHRPILR